MQIDAEFKNQVETCQEAVLYSIINALGYFLWRMNHDLADGRIPESKEMNASLAEAQERIQCAVSQTARFGIEEPFEKDSKGASPEYWKWFRAWDLKIKGLSEEEWHKFDSMVSNGGDLSSYKPDELKGIKEDV